MRALQSAPHTRAEQIMAESGLHKLGVDQRRAFWTSFVVGGLVLIGGILLAHGYDFYRLPLHARPDHDAYRVLSPTGEVGQGYGVVGTGLILLNLLYLVRKKLASWPLGSLRVWLEIHVFTGLAGSLIILFHSAFQLRSALATIAAFSLLLLVVTGLVGRYLVALSPRVDPKKQQASYDALDEMLEGLGPKIAEIVRGSAFFRFDVTPGLLRALWRVPQWWNEARVRRQSVNVAVKIYAKHYLTDSKDRRFTRRLGRVAGRLAAKEVHAEAATTLLGVWRRLHRFFAILMVLSVSVHVGVAWFYGYRWIWSG